MSDRWADIAQAKGKRVGTHRSGRTSVLSTISFFYGYEWHNQQLSECGRYALARGDTTGIHSAPSPGKAIQ